jgi:hypothetical protein
MALENKVVSYTTKNTQISKHLFEANGYGSDK